MPAPCPEATMELLGAFAPPAVQQSFRVMHCLSCTVGQVVMQGLAQRRLPAPGARLPVLHSCTAGLDVNCIAGLDLGSDSLGMTTAGRQCQTELCNGHAGHF